MEEFLKNIRNGPDAITKCLDVITKIETELFKKNGGIIFYNKEDSIKTMFYLYATKNSDNFENFLCDFESFYENNFIIDDNLENLNVESYNNINNKLEYKFNLISKLFSGKEYKILITNSKNKTGYGGSTCLIGESSILTLLYKIDEDYSLVYLHELGHILAYYLTGSLSKVPDSFKDRIKTDNENHYIEIFADIFAICMSDMLEINYESAYFNNIKDKINVDYFNKYFIKLISS